MGQRLNLEFQYGDKVIANAYYHWSGYTIDSLIELLTVHELMEYDNIHDEKSAIIELVNVYDNKLHKLSGLTLDSLDEVKKYIPEYSGVKNELNRNFGLLSISEKGMNLTREWMELILRYDIKNKKIIGNNAVFETDINIYPIQISERLKEITSDEYNKYMDFETYDISEIRDLIEFYKANHIILYDGKYYDIII
jgi:hypothetical protein